MKIRFFHDLFQPISPILTVRRCETVPEYVRDGLETAFFHTCIKKFRRNIFARFCDENHENADLNEDQIDAMLDSQILDLSECLTELDDYTKTASFS